MRNFFIDYWSSSERFKIHFSNIPTSFIQTFKTKIELWKFHTGKRTVNATGILQYIFDESIPWQVPCGNPASWICIIDSEARKTLDHRWALGMAFVFPRYAHEFSWPRFSFRVRSCRLELISAFKKVSLHFNYFLVKVSSAKHLEIERNINERFFFKLIIN